MNVTNRQTDTQIDHATPPTSTSQRHQWRQAFTVLRHVTCPFTCPTALTKQPPSHVISVSE